MEISFPGVWRARGSAHLIVPGQKKATPPPTPPTPTPTPEMELFQSPFPALNTTEPACAPVPHQPKRKRKRKAKPRAAKPSAPDRVSTVSDSSNGQSHPPSGASDPNFVSVFECED